MLAWIFLFVVLAVVGKLVYDIQQTKKENKQSNDEFEAKEQFQKLAGIGQPKNEIDPEIWKYIANKVSEEKFPEPDPSIPVKTTKITTIDTNFGNDNDPLASVPMSRVSKQAKQKMAQIAKEDIKISTEQYSKEIISKGLVTMPTETKPKRKYKKKPKA